MAKIKITSNQNAKAKINEWKAGANQTNELIYDIADLDGKDIQMWAFKQDVLVDVLPEIGPFMKIVFVSMLT